MKKKFVVIGIFILIIILIVIVSILTMNKDNESNIVNNTTNLQIEIEEEQDDEEEIEEEENVESVGDIEEESNWIDYSNTYTNVTNPTYFYVVQSCIKEYVYNIYELDDEDSEKTTNEIRKTIYNTLSSDYIKEKNITIDNIEDYIRIDETDAFIGIKEMKQLNIEENKVMRYVARCMMSGTDGNMTYLNFIVYLDYYNVTYAIEPVSNTITDLTKVNLNSNISEINLNDDNEYTLNGTTTEMMLSNYLKIISKLCLKYPDVAYEYLNEDYKKEKYSTITSFEEFIEKNEDRLEEMEISNYTTEKNVNDGVSQYLIMTNNGYQIRIVQTAIMQFNFEIL